MTEWIKGFTHRDLILVEDNVMREASIVLPGHAVTSLDRDICRLEHERAGVAAHLNGHGTRCLRDERQRRQARARDFASSCHHVARHRHGDGRCSASGYSLQVPSL